MRVWCDPLSLNSPFSNKNLFSTAYIGKDRKELQFIELDPEHLTTCNYTVSPLCFRETIF